MKAHSLGIVIPCFNEEAVIRETTNRLVLQLEEMRNEGLISSSSYIFYVDDGSTDRTWATIIELSKAHPEVCGIKMSRNRGHQNALLCGLLNATGEIIISADADLQDDLNIIPKMISHYNEGYEIVYAVRNRRDTDKYFKRFTAEAYYKILAAMKVDIVFNHADYRLMSRRTVNALSEYHEVNLFLRGIVRLLGYKSTTIEYNRVERFSGESKYPLRKMLAFAWDGITSFSVFPLRLITGIGFFISIISIGFGFWGLVASMFFRETVPGWASTVIPMYFLGGIELLSLGIIGEYISKIFMETKKRPRFNIDETIGIKLQYDEKQTLSQRSESTQVIVIQPKDMEDR